MKLGVVHPFLRVNFAYFPIFSAVIVCTFLAICAALTVSLGHIPRKQRVPMISDTGAEFPEYGVFFTGLTIGGILLAIGGGKFNVK